jgi:hypothetical protein
MPLSFRRPQHWLPEAFLFAAVAMVSSACAVSRPYDAPAAVVLRDGKPCLFAPSPAPSASTTGWAYVGVAALDREGTARGVWDLDITVQRPTTADLCIPYGESTQPQNVRVPPAPLSDDVTPYRAILNVGTPGTADRGRFGVWFCYGKDAGGTPRLTRLDDNTLRCTAQPLSVPK